MQFWFVLVVTAGFLLVALKARALVERDSRRLLKHGQSVQHGMSGATPEEYIRVLRIIGWFGATLGSVALLAILANAIIRMSA